MARTTEVPQFLKQAFERGVQAALQRLKISMNMADLGRMATQSAGAKTHPGLRDPKTFMPVEKPMMGSQPLAGGKKVGSVFGSRVPWGADVSFGTPYEHRRGLYERHLQDKAQEQPTGYAKSMLVGGGLGALAGGALGSGLGGMAAMSDHTAIQDAQYAMQRGDVDGAFARHLAEEARTR